MEWIIFIVVVWVVFKVLKAAITPASRAKPTSTRAAPKAAPQFSIEISSPQRYSSSSRLTPEKSAQQADRLWLGRNTPVKIGPYSIPKGFLYVGSGLPAVAGWSRPEPALINPKIRIAPGNPAKLGEGMSYWPCYSDDVLPRS
ncbi:MAG: TerB N-terminal domain-containing protein [Candidatus Tectomicrobia bacterium]|uniref:TerB N-terminal domain-containing protein n=1 Tax=Tectimicrobiota bacterium TaxID=2528274 RepID=A0A932I1I5_UNCTE|nr:TerB N-terminal domain-containing protein [Candidatus Tectomicrobia bacterium]